MGKLAQIRLAKKARIFPESPMIAPGVDVVVHAHEFVGSIGIRESTIDVINRFSSRVY